MPIMTLELDGDRAWPDLAGKSDLIHLANGAPPIQVAVLSKGMVSGWPSVALRLDLPDGRIVVAETSAALFVCAGRAIATKYPEFFDPPTGDAIRSVALAAAHALRSYQYGNASPDLAEEIADALEAALGTTPARS